MIFGIFRVLKLGLIPNETCRALFTRRALVFAGLVLHAPNFAVGLECLLGRHRCGIGLDLVRAKQESSGQDQFPVDCQPGHFTAGRTARPLCIAVQLALSTAWSGPSDRPDFVSAGFHLLVLRICCCEMELPATAAFFLGGIGNLLSVGAVDLCWSPARVYQPTIFLCGSDLGTRY